MEEKSILSNCGKRWLVSRKVAPSKLALLFREKLQSVRVVIPWLGEVTRTNVGENDFQIQMSVNEYRHLVHINSCSSFLYLCRR